MGGKNKGSYYILSVDTANVLNTNVDGVVCEFDSDTKYNLDVRDRLWLKAWDYYLK
jgi:hypothetical protein